MIESQEQSVLEIVNKEYGIVDGFIIGEGTGLNPAITSGRILTPKGLRTVDDTAIGSLTDSQTTYLYYDVETEVVDHKSSNAPDNPQDILLGIVTCAGADITEIRLGQWVSPRTISLIQSLDLTGTSNYGVYEHFGPPTYVLGATIVPVVNTVGTSASVKVRKVTAAGTASDITTTTVSAQTADTTDIAGAPNFRTIATPTILRPGDRLFVDIATAIGTSGSADVLVHLGGKVLE